MLEQKRPEGVESGSRTSGALGSRNPPGTLQEHTGSLSSKARELKPGI